RNNTNIQGNINLNKFIYVGSGKIGTDDGINGSVLANGFIELTYPQPYINFNLTDDTSDFQSRIILTPARNLEFYSTKSASISATNLFDYSYFFNANAVYFGAGFYYNAIAINVNGLNLNSVTASGEYRCTQNSIVTTQLNCPTSLAYHLSVKLPSGSITSSQYVVQQLVDYNSNHYVRSMVGTTWSAWKRILNTDDLLFSKSTTITAIATSHNLSDYTYDIRYNYTGAEHTSGLLAFTGGKDGHEYILSINNTGTGDLTITLPSSVENHQIDPEGTTSVICKVGRVTEIFIKYILVNT
ncbi:MAG: pyocin knob domain-containing protein, partial [Tannerellaceae bacterium]|nr:pyocin knob domain-containing protein [Tannerellaceae bacterium]